MIVTIQNVTSGQVYVSLLRRSLAVGEVTNLQPITQPELEREVQLLNLVATNQLTLTIQNENTDSVVSNAYSPEQLPFALGTKTIYARSSGNDTSGSGTLASPYRTMQRAVRDVPLTIGPGLIYRIDITGINELLPPDYTLPAWKAPNIDDAATGTYQNFQPPIEIFATPQPVAAIPLADTIINVGDVSSVTTDALTGLKTINLTTPRASWTSLHLRGKQVLDSAAAVQHCVVAKVISTSAILLTNASAPTFPLRLVEPGAFLHGSGENWGTIRANNIDCIGFTGIKITSDNGIWGLVTDGSGTCICQLCELDSPLMQQQGGGAFDTNANRALRSWIYNFPTFLGTVGVVQSLVDAATPVRDFGYPFFHAPVNITIRRCVFDGCDPIEVSVYEPGGNIDGAVSPHIVMQNTLVKNGVGDGMVFHGVKAHLTGVDFAGNTGNGLTARMGAGLIDIRSSGSSVINGGFGLQVDDGMQVVVDAATSGNGTPLNGTGGQIKVGNLGAVSWATFTGAGSNKADYTGATATGARLTLK